MEILPVIPQVPEANSEELPMSRSVGRSSFGLLDETEGSSHKLIASVGLASVILAGTFFIVVGIGRPAQTKASEPTQAHNPASGIECDSGFPDPRPEDCGFGRTGGRGTFGQKRRGCTG